MESIRTGEEIALKATGPKGLVGSNPTLSASYELRTKMSIDHIWDKLTDEERADLEAYIDEAVEDEKHDFEQQLLWDHESEVEKAYEQGYNDSTEENIRDRWPVHNELGHVGSLEMCKEMPCSPNV